MIKLKVFINLEKEEKWLTEMAERGWEVNKVSLFYHFTKIVPYKGIYKIDFREFKNKYDFEDYKSIFEDSGWTHIAGTKTSGLQYFKCKSENSNNDIFSDSRSRAVRYKRMSDRYLLYTVPFLSWLLTMICGGTINLNYFLSPKSWYLTPGLWDMEGTKFIYSFLFETPFAVMRGCSWLIVVFFIMMNIIFSIKTKRIYKKHLKSDK